jgi:hypothetical protein
MQIINPYYMKKKLQHIALASLLLTTLLSACSSGNKTPETTGIKETIISNADVKDSASNAPTISENENKTLVKQESPVVYIYNFHVTNRCVSCIAIEEATTKTLNTYFAAEMKQGRIKRQVLNVDDEANAAISEKYQAFGSSLYVTRVFKGKETIADLTGTGFKFAKNKEEKFIEVLKNKITEYLK